MIPFLFAWVVFWISWATTGASALNILWPTGPQAGTNVSVQFSGGTTPYVLFVNDKNTSEIVYTYTGNANITYWEVNVDSGTVVTFQVTDETGLSVTSDPVTVLANAQSEVASVSSVSLQRLSSLSVSLETASEASIASIASISSISITSFQVHATQTVSTSGSYTWTWTRTWSIQPGSTIHGSTPTSSSGGGGGGGGGNHTGAIVGGVVGGILGLALLAAAAFVLMKRRKYGVVPQSPSSSEAGGHPMTQTGGGGTGAGLAGAGAAAGAYAGSEHATGTTGPSSAQSYGGSSLQQQQQQAGYHPTTYAPGAIPAAPGSPFSPSSPSEHPMSMSMHTADTGPGMYPQTMYGSSGPSTYGGQSSFPSQSLAPGSNSMQSPTGNRGQWSGLPEL